jgi:hypothetical protein
MPDLARHYRCHVRLPELRLGFRERPTDCAFGWKDAPRQEESLDFMVVARTKYATPMRTFWIDALCIDQDSIAKRNPQVAQMGRISASASEVIAWFGIPSPSPVLSQPVENWKRSSLGPRLQHGSFGSTEGMTLSYQAPSILETRMDYTRATFCSESHVVSERCRC